MGARTFKTSEPPNRQATEGTARAPKRSRGDGRAPAGGERVALGRRTGAAHLDRKAVTAKPRGRNLENLKPEIDQKVACLVSNPISDTGGAVGLQGSLAPGGAIAKVAEMTELPFFEPTWAFDGDGGATAGRAVAGEAVACRLGRYVCEASVVHWREAWKAPVNVHQCGVLRTYADQVEPARKGAVSHAGGRTNVVCDAEV
jgi:dehydratase family protein